MAGGLPGLRRVTQLLNGTAGVKRVASSRVHRKRNPLTDGAEGGGAEGDDADADGAEAGSSEGGDEGTGSGGAVTTEASVSGVLNRLVIRIDGTGNYGAHRLVASFENDRGMRTQQLFVSCEPDFSIGQLRDVLRALQPVLNFILDDGGGMDSVPF